MKVFTYPYTAVISRPHVAPQRCIGELTACCRATALRIIPGAVFARLVPDCGPVLIYVEKLGRGQFAHEA